LEEEFPTIAQFLRGDADHTIGVVQQPSQYAQELVADRLTDEMMLSVQEVMKRAEADGHDPDEELTDLVTRVLMRGLNAGEDLAEQDAPSTRVDSSKPPKIQKKSE